MEKFFTPINICYDLSCSEVLVPWVHEFEELIQKDAVIAILDKQSGEFKPGVYKKVDQLWVMVLNYEALCWHIAKRSTFKLIEGLAAAQAVPASTTVYRNGFEVPGVTTLTVGPKILWCLATASSGGGSGPSGTAVPLTDMFGAPLGNFLTV